MSKDYKEWELLSGLSCEDFILKMLKLGKPIETSLVGAFQDYGRGSLRDIDLGLHKDGDFTKKYKKQIDIVGLYCIKQSPVNTVIETSDGSLHTVSLKEGQGLMIDNNLCRHGRKGRVGERILLRIWISRSK